jgi:hypothetical protein
MKSEVGIRKVEGGNRTRRRPMGQDYGATSMGNAEIGKCKVDKFLALLTISKDFVYPRFLSIFFFSSDFIYLVWLGTHRFISPAACQLIALKKQATGQSD